MSNADTSLKSQEERQADFAPETHNDEQDDHRSQAQEVADQAQDGTHVIASPTESLKVATSSSNLLGEGADMIDQMRDMEDSGAIDMDAFANEPNHDDNVDKYGAENKLDGLRGDGN